MLDFAGYDTHFLPRLARCPKHLHQSESERAAGRTRLPLRCEAVEDRISGPDEGRGRAEESDHMHKKWSRPMPQLGWGGRMFGNVTPSSAIEPKPPVFGEGRPDGVPGPVQFAPDGLEVPLLAGKFVADPVVGQVGE